MMRTSFWLYLESAGSNKNIQELKQKYGQESVVAAQEFWSGRILNPTTTREHVEALLESPDYFDSSILAYYLPQRPGYHYVFEFDPNRNLLLNSGYRRIGSPLDFSLPPLGSEALKVYISSLVEISATASEVELYLGIPTNKYGWWPIEVWEYSNGICLTLRHRLVEIVELIEPY
jgi:hypothetical protein